MVYIDSHSHSKNSPDARNSVHDMCAKAKELGLTQYTITDHVECNALRWECEVPDGTGPYFRDIFEKSMKDIYLEREQLGSSLELLAGIELGEPCQNTDISESYIKDKRLDFVIGSIHQIRGHRDFYFLDYDKYDIDKLLNTYFEEIYETCKWNGADVIGHLTYTLRYMQGEQGHIVDMNPYDDIIRECFKTLAENGKGIEVNTSGKRQKYGDFFPHEKYIKMFRECGGEIITVGSDSHCTADLGKDIPQAIALIKSCGFDHIAYFRQRKPVFIKI